MNDDDVLTAVRDPLTEVHMTTPLDEITRRGKGLRNRRRLGGVTGLAGLAGVAAVTAALLVPGGTNTPPVPGGMGRQAAWTVTKVSNDTIKVSFNELKDPEGLQRALRADGIPAHVEFDRLPPSDGETVIPAPEGCRLFREWPSDKALPIEILDNTPRTSEVAIHPSDIPNGVGVSILVAEQKVRIGNMVQDGTSVGVDIVYATPECTGS